MKHYDVLALGELLIDLVQCGRSTQGNPLLEANPGGAPCNVLALLAKLGHRTGFLGKVGQDAFGDQLAAALTEAGIDTRGLSRTEEARTTLAVVQNSPDGERSFTFYRQPGADTLLSESELEPGLLEDCKIFHYGTLSMTREPCRTATRRAVERAEAAGALLSFDPNLRENLWPSLEDARQAAQFGLTHCSVLKISDNELQWLSGEAEPEAGLDWLRARYPIPLVLLSLGKQGSCADQNGLRVLEPACPVPNVIETTGAGDTFLGGVLHFILEHGWRAYTADELSRMLRFANAAAAIITTRRGALRVMPNQAEIEALLGNL